MFLVRGPLFCVLIAVLFIARECWAQQPQQRGMGGNGTADTFAAVYDEQKRYITAGGFVDTGPVVFEDVANAAERAAAIAAKCTACHEKLGRGLVATGDAGGEVKELETAAQLDPKNPKMHFELGRPYRATGALEKSRAEFALSQALSGAHSQE